MSTTETTTRHRVLAGVAVLVPVAVVVGGWLLLREYGPGNMGTGFLQGGVVGLAALAVVIWRVSRRPQSATTFERAWLQSGDERDDAVLTRALAVLGLLSFPMTAVAAIAIAVGAEPAMVLALLMLAEIAVGAVAFTAINRRS